MALEQVVLILFAAMVALCTWLLADRMRIRTAKRVQEMDRCARLLRVHGDALDTVLSSDDVPVHLKSYMIRLSDHMADRVFVRGISAALREALAHPLDAPPESEATTEFNARLAMLPEDLKLAVMTAMASAALAALMRWPESADAASDAAIATVVDRARANGGGTWTSLIAGLSLGIPRPHPNHAL
jgi:hypothetical protein